MTVPLRRRLLRAFAARPGVTVAALLGPGTLWLAVFFVAPLLIILVYTVLPRGMYGGVETGFTLDAWLRLLDPLYLRIVLRSVLLASTATLLCLAAGYPVAWVIARSGRRRNLLLLLVVLPFWTSQLVRTYAMIFLLRDTGLINGALLSLGVIRRPLTLLYTPGAVLAGLVYTFLPFMILPIYATLEKLDLALLEAAEVLGARSWARFRRVILPLSAPGVAAGSLLVFIPALGAFLTPDLLGGAKEMMIGNLIENQFTTARDWPFGSAASYLVMALVLAAVLIYLSRRDRAAQAT